MSSRVEVISLSPELAVDLAAAAKEIEALAVGLILRRVADGNDIKDQPFAPYSDSYRKSLSRAGRDTDEDLRLSGGLLTSVKVTGTQVIPGGFEISIAPDTGSSPRVNLSSNNKKKKKPGMTQVNRPHNVIGYWLQEGTEKMPARPWLGLSPKDREALIRRIVKVLVKK